VPAVDRLADAGLLEHDRKRPFNLGWQSRFRAGPALVSFIRTATPALEHRPGEPIRLRDVAGDLMGYRDTKRTHAMRQKLSHFNEALAATTLDIAAGTPGIERSGNVIRLSEHHAVCPGAQALHRVFNRGSFALGGRFYGGWWQSLPENVRKHLEIAGEPTVEADYGQTHPRMLAAELGTKIDGDVYDVAGWPRDQAKLAVNVLINAETHPAAVGAIAREIAGPGGFARATKLIEAIKHRHPQLAGALHTGAGLRLQRRDADMAETIVTRLFNRGIAAFPIHDSFIVAAKHEGKLIEEMTREWHRSVGQNPYVKTKT
jgi:hypothetical protein